MLSPKLKFSFLSLALWSLNLIYPVVLAQTPIFDWATSTGGINSDQTTGVSTDVYENVYVSGIFQDTIDLNPGPATQTAISSGGYDYFLQKFDSTGNFIWGFTIGSIGDDRARHMVGDASGNTYVTGHFQGTVDFDPGVGVANEISTGTGSLFIQKINAGGDLVWVKTFNGTLGGAPYGIALDTLGNVLSTGFFFGATDFDPGPGNTTLTSNGSADIFVVKLDSNGNFSWAHSFGSPASDEGFSIATDLSGGIYVSGVYRDTVDFDPGSGNTLTNAVGQGDVFVLKLTASGNFGWVRTNGGPSAFGIGWEIATDIFQNVYIAGTFSGSVDFDPGSSSNTISSAGASDIFFQKLDSAGGLDWVQTIGNTGTDGGFALAVDLLGNSYVAGLFQGTVDFDPGLGITNKIASGTSDVFAMKLDINGNLVWVESVGGALSENAFNCNLTSSNKLVVGGVFSGSADFDPGLGVSILVSAGGNDSYVFQLDQQGCGGTSTFSTNVTSCDSFTVAYGNVTYISTGTYQDTLVSIQGCSLITTLNLVIGNSSITTVLDTACNSYTSPSGNYTWSTSGTYQDTLASALGCDSVLIIQLIIHNSNSSVITVTNCDSYTSPSGSYVWTNSGTYLDTLINSFSCDSVITIHLSILNSSTSFQTVSCDGSDFQSPSGNHIWTSNGTFTDTLVNSVGCDSIIVIDLTLNGGISSVINDTICKGESFTFPSGDSTSLGAGSYQDTLSNAAGCDSIIAVNIAYPLIDVSVDIGAGSLEAQNAGASYQWLDCDQSYTPIAGENFQTFLPAENGNYAVELTENRCSDTSACYSVINVGIATTDFGAHFQIYPNPTTGKVTLDLGEQPLDFTVSVKDVLSKTIATLNFEAANHAWLELTGPPGLYFIQILTSDQKLVNFKLLKE